MQDRVTYEYAVIRLVPKVEREEFLNIGVIVYSKKKKYLSIKYKLDRQRILSFSEEVDTELIASYLKAWDLICEGHPEGGKIAEMDQSMRFRWLVATRSTIIQSSKAHTGLCHEPQDILIDLFNRYVL
jgi:hypothetical protein